MYAVEQTVYCCRKTRAIFKRRMVMTVNPGFGGQALLPECMKIGQIQEMMQQQKLKIPIEIDGGVPQIIAIFNKTICIFLGVCYHQMHIKRDGKTATNIAD